MLGQSPYELWVRRLREWGRDPTTPLDDLPALTGKEEFTPEFFTRFVEHLMNAQSAFMDVFQERLQQVFDQPGDLQTIARSYHDLQYLYARRFTFARHRGLPKDISDQLVKGAKADLREIQRQVEETVGKNKGSGALSSTNDLERVIKDNSLLQLLNADFSVAPLKGDGIKERVNLIPTYDSNKG
jgi:hypothetical protein